MNKLQNILQQEVTRKEFLQYVGLALLGVIGVTSFLQNLTSSMSRNVASQHLGSGGGGYGHSKYGR